jgi:ABC-type transporter Mla subunit MlaD
MSLVKRNLSDYLVALSVIACSLVLLGALTFALSGYRFKKPTRTLQIYYQDVTGIRVNSEVRYAGAPAGRVVAVKYLSAKEREASPNKNNAVRVTVSLNEAIPPLPADVIATLGSDTLLAPKFVALSAGTPGGQTLANNAAIEGHPAYDLEQIMAAAGPLLDNLNTTVTNLKHDLGEFTPKLGPLADSLKLDVDNLQNLITNLEGVGKNADTVLGTADRFISATDKQLQEDLKQLHVTLLNLKVVSTYAKQLVGTLAEKPNRVIFSGKPATLTPESEILKSSKPMPARKP